MMMFFFTGFPPKTKNECHLIPNGFYSKRIPMCVCDVQIMWLVVQPHTHASDKLMTRPSSSFGCEIIHQNTMKPITSERIKKLSIEHLPPHFSLSKFTLLHQMVGSCSLWHTIHRYVQCSGCFFVQNTHASCGKKIACNSIWLLCCCRRRQKKNHTLDAFSSWEINSR